MNKKKFYMTFQHKLSEDEVEVEISRKTDIGKYLKEAEEMIENE